MSRWCRVVDRRISRNRTGGRGGYRVELLECGHKWIGKQSVRLADRRRCDSCPSDARDNPGPTTGVPKRTKPAKKAPRKQCKACPFKVSTDPYDIPNGYCPTKHAALKSTIAEPESLHNLSGPVRVMACHETSVGRELPCVGWLMNQLGPGNNIALRLRVALGLIDANVKTVGPQHERLEDTLPPGYL